MAENLEFATSRDRDKRDPAGFAVGAEIAITTALAADF
jgi:hypothetical protein